MSFAKLLSFPLFAPWSCVVLKEDGASSSLSESEGGITPSTLYLSNKGSPRLYNLIKLSNTQQTHCNFSLYYQREVSHIPKNKKYCLQYTKVSLYAITKRRMPIVKQLSWTINSSSSSPSVTQVVWNVTKRSKKPQLVAISKINQIIFSYTIVAYKNM